MKFYIEKIFIRSTMLYLTILLFLISFAFGIYLMTLNYTGFQLLYVFVRVNFYICFTLSVISYQYISAANRNYVKESADCVRGRGYFERQMLLIVFLIDLIWNVFVVILLISASLCNDGTNYFLSWFMPIYLVNVLTPQIICIMLTFLVAESINILRWVLLEILFLFMISPFAESITWKVQPAFPIDQIWSKLHWIFCILYQNSIWSPDVQGCMQSETPRIFVLLFWVLLLIGIYALRFNRKRILGVLLIICSIVTLIFSFQPSSLYRLDNSWNGMWYDYQSYSDETSTETVADFRVTSYNIDLQIKNQLVACAQLDIQPNTYHESYIFTLYRGYQVSSVTCNGQELSYIQEKDYLTIFYPSQEEFTIRISYKGKNNKFYSNAKQTLLPGWFAWYPMAGSHAVFLTYKDYGLMYGYNPYNRIDTAEVTITSDIPLVSNLTQLDSNTYSGYTDGITILSGNFAETGDTVVPYCLPLLLEKTKTTEIFAKELQEQYHSVLKTLKTVYGVDTSVLENKKILIASSDLSKNMTNNDIAIFNDYILTTPYGITEDNIMKYLILQDRKLTEERTNSFEMQQLLFSMNFSGDAQMDYDSINELLCEQKNEPLYTFIQEQEPHEFVKKIVSFMLGTSQYNFTDFQKETDAK